MNFHFHCEICGQSGGEILSPQSPLALEMGDGHTHLLTHSLTYSISDPITADWPSMGPVLKIGYLNFYTRFRPLTKVMFKITF